MTIALPDELTEFDLDATVACEFYRKLDKCDEVAEWKMIWKCNTTRHVVLACNGHKDGAQNRHQLWVCTDHDSKAELIEITKL